MGNSRDFISMNQHKKSNTYRLFTALMIVTSFGIVVHWISQIDNVDHKNRSQMQFIRLKRSNPGNGLRHPKMPYVVANEDVVSDEMESTVSNPKLVHSDTERIPIKIRKRTARRLKREKRDVTEPSNVNQVKANISWNKISSNNDGDKLEWRISANASRKLNDSGVNTVVQVDGKDNSFGRQLLHSWDNMGRYLGSFFGQTSETKQEILTSDENTESLSLKENFSDPSTVTELTNEVSTLKKRSGKIFNWLGFNTGTKNGVAKDVESVNVVSNETATNFSNFEVHDDLSTGEIANVSKENCSFECDIMYDHGANGTSITKTCRCKGQRLGETSVVSSESSISDISKNLSNSLLFANNCSVTNAEDCNLNHSKTNSTPDSGSTDFEITEMCLNQLMATSDIIAERLNEMSGNREVFQKKTSRKNLNLDQSFFDQFEENEAKEVFFRIAEDLARLRAKLTNNSENEVSNLNQFSQFPPGKNSTRSAKFLSAFGLFNFFGSGSGPRMVDENVNETLEFDTGDELASDVASASKNASDILPPIDIQCFTLIREVLNGQHQVTQPNLLDLIIHLAKDNGKSKGDSLSKVDLESKQPATTVPKVKEVTLVWNSSEPLATLDQIEEKIELNSSSKQMISIDELPEPCRQAIIRTSMGMSEGSGHNSDSEFEPRFFLRPIPIGSGDELKFQDRDPKFFLGPILGSGFGSSSANEPRFFLGLGSGGGRNSEIDSRFFINFGSGDGRDNGRSFLRPILGSGDEFSISNLEPCRGIELIDGRLFGSIFGSGDGRTNKEMDSASTFTSVTKDGRGRGSRMNDEAEDDFDTFSTSVATIPRVMYCRFNQECSTELNERCVPYGADAVCDCGRSYVRHPVTRKCLVKVALRASLRFPDETYEVSLKDVRSKVFSLKRRAAETTIRQLIKGQSFLSNTVIDIMVTGFSRGSLIVTWNMILASPETVSLLDFGDTLESNLRRALRQAQSTRVILPFNIRRASFVDIIRAINPCEHADLNSCDHNADCHRDDRNPGGFFCSCRENFMDLSENISFRSGEICKAICPANFCGANGVCTINQNGMLDCLCTSFYFGKRCEISGIIVVICAAIANLVILIAAFCCCYWIRKRRRSRRGNRFHSQFVRSQDVGLYTMSTMPDPVAPSPEYSYPPARYTKVASPTELHQIPRPPEINVIPPSYSDCTFSVDSSFCTSPESRTRQS